MFDNQPEVFPEFLIEVDFLVGHHCRTQAIPVRRWTEGVVRHRSGVGFADCLARGKQRATLVGKEGVHRLQEPLGTCLRQVRGIHGFVQSDALWQPVQEMAREGGAGAGYACEYDVHVSGVTVRVSDSGVRALASD